MTSGTKGSFLLGLVLAWGCLALQAFGQNPLPWPKFGPNALRKVHPGYDFADLLPQNAADLSPGFSGHIAGMGFLPDGKLAVMDFKDPFTNNYGSVWILDGVLTGDRNKVKFKKVGDQFYMPGGLAVLDGEIYVINNTNLFKLKLNAANDSAVRTQLAQGWSGGGQPPVQDMVFHNGYFYAAFGKGAGTVTGTTTSVKGGVVKISKDGKTIERLITGLRNPNGMGLGPNGEVFVMDVQGEWIPSNKVIHVVPGRFYGHAETRLNNQAETPPSIWIPHGVVDGGGIDGQPAGGDASVWAAGSCPSSMTRIPFGPLAGQYLVGDIRYGNVHRVFLEKVENEYQGALFHFSGGFRGGVQRMAWGPDSSLYLGIIGGTQITWSWINDRVDDNWGLHRIKPNAKSVFEILSVSAKRGGFDLAFTQPLAPNAAAPGNFKVHSWRYQATSTYGGLQLDMKPLTVDSVGMSSDKLRIFLKISGLEAGRVVRIELDSNKVISSGGLKPWSFETWYTLNKVGSAPTTLANPAVPAGGKGWFSAKGAGNGRILLASDRTGRYAIRNVRGTALEEGILEAGRKEMSHKRFGTGLYFISLPGNRMAKVIF